MRLTKPVSMLAALLIAVAALTLATSVRADEDEGEGQEEEYDIVKIFFEFNSSDDDLGLQVLLDGKAWNRLKITDPDGRKIVDLKAQGGLSKLGLTELFFESAEPSPDEVLALFQEGTYEFEGRTVDGNEIEGEADLSHDLADPPVIISPTPGQTGVSHTNLIVTWAPIAGIASWEAIVGNEATGAEMTVPLSSSATSLHVPDEFLDPNTEYKVEVLAIAANGNKTITEHVFFTGP